jgi:hypothetical protein
MRARALHDTAVEYLRNLQVNPAPPVVTQMASMISDAAPFPCDVSGPVSRTGQGISSDELSSEDRDWIAIPPIGLDLRELPWDNSDSRNATTDFLDF